MFSRPSCIAFLALAASIISVSATPSISLEVIGGLPIFLSLWDVHTDQSSGPVSVNDIVDLKVTTIIRNTGDETLTLLEDPHGALSTFPADTFVITNANGTSPNFTGYMIKFSPEDAAENGETITLAPGEFKAVEHDLSETYNFAASGAGMYNIEAYNVFIAVKDKKLGPIRAISKALSVRISGRLTLSTVVHTTSNPGHPAFEGCSAKQQQVVLVAAKAAQDYANEAYAYLLSDPEPTPRFTTWFGASEDGYATVLDHFEKIREEDFTSFTYHCTELGCRGNAVYAYVKADEYGVVHLCRAFWRAPLTGTNSKGGTLVHEVSHFLDVASTKDVPIGNSTTRAYYGHKLCKELALNMPEKAIINADNHEYFAENNPAQLVDGLEVELNSASLAGINACLSPFNSLASCHGSDYL
ncbi:zincin [Pluteus cervinus]|uniref:Zincin n=1 Tax=Pluteus cervinus TaxID=181527 RepID=A0ACD3B3R6_9AGAR|nr:zincin [Pluteus cervinus]